MVEQIAPWEKHGRGIGTKLLLKSGYVLGEGIPVPIERHPIKIDKAGFGLTSGHTRPDHDKYAVGILLDMKTRDTEPATQTNKETSGKT